MLSYFIRNRYSNILTNNYHYITFEIETKFFAEYCWINLHWNSSKYLSEMLVDVKMLLPNQGTRKDNYGSIITHLNMLIIMQHASKMSVIHQSIWKRGLFTIIRNSFDGGVEEVISNRHHRFPYVSNAAPVFKECVIASLNNDYKYSAYKCSLVYLRQRMTFLKFHQTIGVEGIRV